MTPRCCSAQVLGGQPRRAVLGPRADARATGRVRRGRAPSGVPRTAPAHHRPAGFRYLDLEVGPGVFIPRPETEVMTGVADRRAASAGCRRHVGRWRSTCAPGPARSRSRWPPRRSPSRVVALELSPDAAAYAERNAQATGCRGPGAVISPTRRTCSTTWPDASTWSRPIRRTSRSTAYESRRRRRRATYDPPVALWSGDDGLDAIRLVAEVAARARWSTAVWCCASTPTCRGRRHPRCSSRPGLWSRGP